MKILTPNISKKNFSSNFFMGGRPSYSQPTFKGNHTTPGVFRVIATTLNIMVRDDIDQKIVQIYLDGVARMPTSWRKKGRVDCRTIEACMQVEWNKCEVLLNIDFV
jgi:hypothetical protein